MSDVATIDAIIKALYEVISGPAGQARDWERDRKLFYPGARLIRTIINDAGRPQAQVMDVESYIENAEPYLLANGFFEIETARQTDIFGNIAQVFSTYEGRHKADDPEPFKRGINSIQLYHDGNRWWVMNILWDNEREGNPLPEKYQ